MIYVRKKYHHHRRPTPFESPYENKDMDSPIRKGENYDLPRVRSEWYTQSLTSPVPAPHGHIKLREPERNGKVTFPRSIFRGIVGSAHEIRTNLGVNLGPNTNGACSILASDKGLLGTREGIRGWKVFENHRRI